MPVKPSVLEIQINPEEQVSLVMRLCGHGRGDPDRQAGASKAFHFRKGLAKNQQEQSPVAGNSACVCGRHILDWHRR